MEARLQDVARLIGATLEGDPEAVVGNLAGIEKAGPGDLAFVANPKYARFIPMTGATAIICAPTITAPGKNLLKVDNPYLAYAKVMQFVFPPKKHSGEVDSRAFIGRDVQLGANVTIYPFAYIGDGCQIGDNTAIYPNCCIGEQVKIGRDTLIYSNVTIRERCVIGSRAIIHAGTVIGSDGFGYAKDGAKYFKIPQVGIVQIDDDVEIGANAAIDRAAMGKTWVQRGTKIDNLVQVAHNVVIGEDSVIVSQVGISGSTKIGNRATLAGQAATVGHITIGDDVIIGARGAASSDIPAGQIVSGAPHMPHRQWLRVTNCIPRLPEMRRTITDLERRVAELEKELKTGSA
jgi:UDP-3-O-[3-hydroxymyristoyl] glucosamine N-acyltransferase